MRAKQARHAANDTRHREDEYVKRRIEIRNKASALFMRHGYRKTTIEDIGIACGLGKAALYHYFASKEEIFAEVVRVECVTVNAQIRAGVAAAGDPRAKLIAMAKTAFSEARNRLDQLVEPKLVSEMAEWLPLIGEPIQQFVDAQVKIVQEILEEGERLGVFRKVSSPSVATIISFGLRGGIYSLLEAKFAHSVEESIDTLLELFMDGLCRQ